MMTPMLMLLAIAAPPAADVAVVCPAAFRAELAPWIEHRVRQGHRLAIIDASRTLEEVRAQLGTLAKTGALKQIVLVGDVPTGRPAVDGVATQYVRAKVNIQWGSEPEIASDHPYSDFDGDQVPDVGIGRLPANSPAELRDMVRKILDYENSTDYGQWRRRVNFVAGLGGFGAMADMALEAAAKKLITDGVPAGYSTSMTFGSWRSPYCPDPREFRRATLDRLNQGCLFWVYIGHGNRRNVDVMRVPGGAFPILADRDMPQLHCRSGSPVACFLACYAGAFDHPEDCLAEQMVCTPGGPVAVYAGSRVTMPYGMAVMGKCMLESCFGDEPAETLGEAVMRTKRRMMSTEDLSADRKALDTLAALISPAPADLAAERAEHMVLFNLLGDPLLRLPQPDRVQLDVPGRVPSGATITVRGLSDIAGQAVVELIVRRDRLTFKPPVRAQFEPTSAFLSRFNETYQKANDPRLVTTQLSIGSNGRFECDLNPPADAVGPCHIRVFVEGEAGCALGHCDLEVH